MLYVYLSQRDTVLQLRKYQFNFGRTLNAAGNIKDMNYPGSYLHQLSGDKKGQYAVKVSGNWRVFFEFIEGEAYLVDYDDYH